MGLSKSNGNGKVHSNTSLLQETREESNIMDTISLTKEAKIHNGEKTISLTSGAGKSGQPLVKE